MSAAAVARPRLRTANLSRNQPLIDRELRELVTRKTRAYRWGTAETVEMILSDLRHLCDQSRLNFSEIDEAANDNFLSEVFSPRERQRR
jgi:hypothetical protein